MNTDKIIDLHTHTTYSDGTLSPRELIELSKKNGLSAVAVTDHDTIAGIREAVEWGLEYNIEVVPGVELETNYCTEKDIEIHILGLYIDINSPDLISYLKLVSEGRIKRNHEIIEKMKELGIKITYDEVASLSASDIVSRVHYAKVLVDKGYVRDKKEAFKAYLGNNRPCNIKKQLPSPRECIEVIRSSGGIPILAHPTLYGLDFFEIEDMAEKLKDAGLMGIEVKYSTYSQKQEKAIKKIAHRLGLLNSGGSDFHGDNKKDISLGFGKGGLSIPYEFLEEIKKKVK